MTRLTESRLAEIKARVDAATSGPWDYCRGASERGCVCGGVHSIPADFPVASTNTDSREEGISSTLERKQNDAIFIAHARMDIPELLTHIESLSTELKEVNFILDGLRK